MSVAQISIRKYDNGSSKICNYCKELAKNALEFRDLCINSDKQLKTLVISETFEPVEIKMEVEPYKMEIDEPQNSDPFDPLNTKDDTDISQRYSLRKSRNAPKKYDEFEAVECAPNVEKIEMEQQDSDEENDFTEVEVFKGFDESYMKSTAKILKISVEDLKTICENFKLKEAAKKFKCVSFGFGFF
jgi:hypothetical protein